MERSTPLGGGILPAPLHGHCKAQRRRPALAAVGHSTLVNGEDAEGGAAAEHRCKEQQNHHSTRRQWREECAGRVQCPSRPPPCVPFPSPSPRRVQPSAPGPGGSLLRVGVDEGAMPAAGGKSTGGDKAGEEMNRAAPAHMPRNNPSAGHATDVTPRSQLNKQKNVTPPTCDGQALPSTTKIE
jgi:hypothetical protein